MQNFNKNEFFEFLTISTDQEIALNNDDKKEVLYIWFVTQVSTK